MSHRTVVLFVVLALWCQPPAFAQDGDRPMSGSIARELLASPDPRQQAWGAWMAGRLLMTDVTPQIERIITAGLASQGAGRRERVWVGLDALIETGAKPDVRLLAETQGIAPVQSLILLSRLGAPANRVLLTMMADSTGYRWFAAANLLKERQAPGFAALLLKDIELVAEVVVSLDGRETSVSGNGGLSVGDKVWSPDGYPPMTDYEFRGCAGPNLSLLAAGPTDVCYEKARPVLSSHGIRGPSVDDRLAYFKFDWYAVELKAVEQVPIAWQSDAATRAALAAVAETVRRKYAAALARLKERGWLTDDEVQALARPRIRESIRDLRGQ